MSDDDSPGVRVRDRLGTALVALLAMTLAVVVVGAVAGYDPGTTLPFGLVVGGGFAFGLLLSAYFGLDADGD